VSQLPEVEVIRKELERDVVGKRVTDATVRSPALVPRHRTRPDFTRALVDRTVKGVSRRGIHLVFELDGGSSLVAKVGEGGTFSRAKDPGGVKGAELVIDFASGGALHYVDGGEDAEFFVLASDELATLPELEKVGIDPLADIFTWHAFGEELVRRAAPLKLLLLDSSFVVGLGDRYSDEILWAAGLAGRRPSAALSSQEVRRLYRAVLEVLHEAVKQRTADGMPTAGEDVDDDEEVGSWLKVWEREGLPCLRCRQPVRYGPVVDQTPSYHCANCQT